MNGLFALYRWKQKDELKQALAWSGLGLVTLILAAMVASGNEDIIKYISFNETIKGVLDGLMSPTTYSLGSLVILLVMFRYREVLVRPNIAWLGLNSMMLFMGLSMADSDFAAIVTKPDNVPIVGLIFLLAFFTWLATSKAVENDRRIANGELPLEATDAEKEKVLVWPDLVYTELICMVALTALMLLWAILLQAPLEEPASAVKTPNPSKAPWYFLGLQEMLVYYDPWMAGVVLPSMIVAGLMAIPYIDYNKKGNGYYTINERKFAYLTFQFGFLVLWVTLIIMGTFLRGPNWNFYGFYEYWDSHAVEAMNNVDLSQYFWVELLGKPLPKPDPEAAFLTKVLVIAQRECIGVTLLIGYFAVLPPLLAMWDKKRLFQPMYKRMGFIRYMVMTNLMLWMALLPIKMLARWVFSMKYFIAIPEYFINF
tara:strand:- start:1148 stop:2425 length:1278 start_codon:yes stop_codon:yes gene_type:complete